MHCNQSQKLKVKSQKYRNGFSMIETMVALSVLVIIGTAIISLVIAVISANTSAKLRNQGLGLAEEGLEQVRSYFQINGFQTLHAQANNKCYSDGSLASGVQIACPVDPAPPTVLLPPNCLSPTPANNGIFSRSLWLTRPADGSVKVRSVVTWSDRGTCRYTEVGTYFYSY